MDKTLHIQPCIFFYLLNFCKRKLSGRDDSASSKLFYQSRPPWMPVTVICVLA